MVMLFHTKAASGYKVLIKNLLQFFFKTLLFRWLCFFITKKHLDIKFSKKCYSFFLRMLLRWLCFFTTKQHLDIKFAKKCYYVFLGFAFLMVPNTLYFLLHRILLVIIFP